MREDKKVVIVPLAKKEMINLVNSSYHYYRNWVIDILTEGGIESLRFVKNSVGWQGRIIVPVTELAKAKKVLKDYKTKNPDTIALWW